MKRILTGFIMDGKAGGIDKYLLNFLHTVSNDTVRIDFLTNEVNPQLEEQLKEYRSRLYAISSLHHPMVQYRQMRKILEKGKYDAVYLNISTAIDCIAAIAAKHAGVKCRMIHSHSSGNDCESQVKRKVFDSIHFICRTFLYRYATQYYGCSIKAGEWLFPKHIVYSSAFKVIHNAVDRDCFEYDENIRKAVRKELCVEKKFVLGHVGNFCYQKNHDFLIDVFEEVLKLKKDAVLLLAGNGIRFQAVKQKAEEKGIMKSVLFLGRRRDVQRLYQAMDVFVLPSNFEGLPIAGIEAQSAGLPCFMSDKITREAKITKKCMFLPFEAEIWAEEIVKETGERKKAEYLENARQYDLKNQDEELRALVCG